MDKQTFGISLFIIMVLSALILVILGIVGMCTGNETFKHCSDIGTIIACTMLLTTISVALICSDD